MSKLTQKQETFVLKYFECGNATEAYKYAYSTKAKSEKSIWENASKLLNSTKVAPRLQELRDKAQKKSEWTVDRLLDTYAEIIRKGTGIEESARLIQEGVGDGVTTHKEIKAKDTNLAAVKAAADSIGKIIGAFEKDNKQRGEISLKDFVKERIDGKR